MKRVLIAMAGCCLVASVAAAQEASPTEGLPTFNAPAPAALLANRVLKKTYVNAGSDSVALPSGFQPIDNATTVSCPGTSGVCAIEVEQHLQVSSGVANNRWAICTQVDGAFLSNPSCPFVGPAQNNGFFDARSFTQTGSGLSFGNHTVRSFVFSDFGINRSIYEITYRIYKP